MKGRGLGVLVGLWTILAGVLGGAGCTSGDIVSSGRSEILLAAVPSPAVDAVYAHARAHIRQVILRPVDEVADRALGSTPIGLIHFPVTVDLKSSRGTTLDRVALGRGEYAGESVRIGRIELNRDSSEPEGTLCSGDELISVAQELPPLAVRLGAADRFTVPPSGEAVLELRVDGEALVNLLGSKCSGGSFTAFPTAEEFEAARVFSLILE